ncbi:uncharacterized protein SPAPADRAFT_137304 [Spathaspora passalidarum NRRL Y-27907]|uniref:Uncharacterized protein n=1 Tax=Spathaspora passalidarum (strain NRRL Y-27907 / 11-Y1) TaxID=619300 RepID=G3AMH9_SPAPN|nr:uncharacterized protein SPAPADRAFT_137304 [Spathaspora passalidarum NRRL Y-27907]EGW32831.1 hypothetical protein SPAPADRAFT_137304 [Spathaspora passalidarum NRRL Y-27907]
MLDPQQRLRKAVIDGNLPIVQRLLSRFPSLWLNVDSAHDGWSNLHYASYYGHYLVCFHLVSFINNDLESKYTKLDLLSFDNLTVLHVCIEGKHLQTLHYLLQEFPGKLWLNYPGGASKQTPLHWSCKYGFSEGTKLLLEFGASWDERDGNGDTCLHHCFQHGNTQCIQEILRYIFQNTNDKEKAIDKIDYFERMRNKRGCVAFDYASSSSLARKYQLLKQDLMALDFSDSGEASSGSSMVYTLHQNQSMHSLETSRILTSPILPMGIQKQEDNEHTIIHDDIDTTITTEEEEEEEEEKPGRRSHSQSLPTNPETTNSLPGTKVRSRSNTNYIYHPPNLNNIPVLGSPRFASPPVMPPPSTPITNRAPSLKSVTISPSVRSNGHDSTEDSQRPESPQSIWSLQSTNTSPAKSQHGQRRSFSFSKSSMPRPRAESASAVANSASVAAKKAFVSSRPSHENHRSRPNTPSQRSRQSESSHTSPTLQKLNSRTSSTSIGSIGSQTSPTSQHEHILRKSQSSSTLSSDPTTIPIIRQPPQRTDSAGSLTMSDSSRKFSVNSISFSRIR